MKIGDASERVAHATTAGLWSEGEGIIHTPRAGQMFFLPQQPFMPLGTLRQQLLFPSGTLSSRLALRAEVQTACCVETVAAHHLVHAGNALNVLRTCCLSQQQLHTILK